MLIKKKVYTFIACEISFVDTKGLIKFSYEIPTLISLCPPPTIIACRVWKNV